jgi:hypothetical protein
MTAATLLARPVTLATCWILTTASLLSGGCVSGPPDMSGSPPTRRDDVAQTCAHDPLRFRITSIDTSPRHDVRLDLDGDGHPDNVLGGAIDSLAAFDPSFEAGPRLAPRLVTDLPWLIVIDACQGSPEARVTLAPAMPGTLDVARDQPRAVGTLIGRALTAGDGVGRVPAIALADAEATTAEPGWLAADGLQLVGTLSPDASTLTATLGLALPTTELRAAIAAPIAAFLTALPDDDLLRISADADHDGAITTAEVLASPTFARLTAGDVNLVGPDGTPRANVPATSLAIKVTATRL